MEMSLHEWAHKWKIDHVALRDLLAQLGALAHEPTAIPGESEAAIQTRVRIAASQAGGRLWRNNVGATQTETGQFIRYGLCNESTAVNRRVKSSDLIGIKPLLITEGHVGAIVGQFVAREVKRGGWKYSATAREVAQLNFINLVDAMGGDAKFTTGA